MSRVVVTGMGAVCANANNTEEFAQACFGGKSGIKKCTAFNTEGLITEYFGQADIDCADADGRLKILIEKSCAEMLSDSGADREYISSEGGKCRLFYGTLLSDAGSYYKHSFAKLNGNNDGDDSLSHMNDYISYVKELTGVKGCAAVSSAACASGTTAAGMAFDYIRNGLCEMAVVGGADPLTVISAYGFNALKSLSGSVCNPYDENRDGINIGECGAFLMFESYEHAVSRGAKIYCEVVGYGIGNDAYHITSPEPDGSGAYRTMLAAAEDGGISADEIDYINGHGTGTAINDRMEINAISRIYGESGKKPGLSSTKALIGHCMGASGAIELISTVLSVKHGRKIYMPNNKELISGAENADIYTQSGRADINYALSDSFAFAGNSAGVLIKKYDGGDGR
jgi:3-oxoacyl-[acyl-carrier-protein] synthase II